MAADSLVQQLGRRVDSVPGIRQQVDSELQQKQEQLLAAKTQLEVRSLSVQTRSCRTQTARALLRACPESTCSASARDAQLDMTAGSLAWPLTLRSQGLVGAPQCMTPACTAAASTQQGHHRECTCEQASGSSALCCSSGPSSLVIQAWLLITCARLSLRSTAQAGQSTHHRRADFTTPVLNIACAVQAQQRDLQGLHRQQEATSQQARQLSQDQQRLDQQLQRCKGECAVVARKAETLAAQNLQLEVSRTWERFPHAVPRHICVGSCFVDWLHRTRCSR